MPLKNGFIVVSVVLFLFPFTTMARRPTSGAFCEHLNGFEVAYVNRDYDRAKFEWSALAGSPSWSADKAIQEKAAHAIVRVASPTDVVLREYLDYFSDATAIRDLFHGLLEKGCYEIVLLDAAPLLDIVPPQVSSALVSSIFNAYMRGDFPERLPRTRGHSCFYVAHFLGVYPSSRGLQDLLRMASGCSRMDQWLGAYIAICYKTKHQVSEKELNQVLLLLDQEALSLLKWEFSYLFSLAENKEAAQTAISRVKPNLPKEWSGTEMTEKTADWVAANYGSITIS